MKKVKIFKNMDKPLLIMTIIYSFLGLLMVLSASNVKAVVLGASPYYYFLKQLLFLGIGYFIGFVILYIPTKVYKKYLVWFLLGCLFLLVLLLVKGQLTNSAKSWFYIGPFGVQPSEFVKLFIIIYLGVFFGNQEKASNKKYSFLIPIAYSVIVFFLVVLQPDLGTAAIIASITFFTFFAIPLEKNKIVKIIKIIAGAGAIILFVLLVTGTNFLTNTQLERLNFKDPCSRYTDYSGTGYQVCNGFIAINTGGLIGKGIGKSTQKYLYLPEAHTDFIFAITVEELGLIFGVALIIGYLFIVYRIFLVAKRSMILRNSIICYGIAIMIITHLVFNLGGMLALIPLTGVSMPFLSYGGCFTLTLLMSMFVIQRINIENNIMKFKSEIKNI